ncbi:MAG: hypothetical protein ABEK17_02680 [Candidatus Aenigmatarchaeota archaeon]
MNFNDNRERRNVLISIILTGFLFSIVVLDLSIDFLFSIPIYILGATIALVVNAYVSRIAAERLGSVFIYKFWLPGFILSIISAVLSMGNIVFAAPASKTIEPDRMKRWEKKQIHLESKEIGKISLVGPLSNFILAVVFWIIFEITSTEFLLTFGFINLWVSVSHLIPYHPLDGARVMVWNDLIWLVSFILPLAGLLLFFF